MWNYPRSSHSYYCCFFFFFSSRRRHTRFDCDWSSDVCSSDLWNKLNAAMQHPARLLRGELLVHMTTSRLECGRQARAKLGEKLVVGGELVFPRRSVDPGEFGVPRCRELFQAGPIEVLVTRHQAKRCFFHIARASPGPLHDPLQHAHVLAKSRPDKSALRVAPKPVDAEDLRRILHSAAHVQPVSEIVAHVIATEREHRHLIAPRSEEHTSELQSQSNLVCRLL